MAIKKGQGRPLPILPTSLNPHPFTNPQHHSKEPQFPETPLTLRTPPWADTTAPIANAEPTPRTLEDKRDEDPYTLEPPLPSTGLTTQQTSTTKDNNLSEQNNLIKPLPEANNIIQHINKRNNTLASTKDYAIINTQTQGTPMTVIKLVPPKEQTPTGQEHPSPLQLMTKILSDDKLKNTEEIFVILVDEEGVITTTHSGLSLERALFYIATTQQMILDEIRGKDVC